MNRVYISASTQRENIGVGAYGNEQEKMFILCDRIETLLKVQGFTVFRNQKGWTLEQTVADCNKLACDLFIDNHTNASVASVEGLEVYYHGGGGVKSNSYKIAKLLYDEISPVAPDVDRGVKPDTTLYANGLYVVRKTNPSACLVEHFFHTNLENVKYFTSNLEKYAVAEVKAICKYFGVQYVVKDGEIDKITKERDELKQKLSYLFNVVDGLRQY